MIYKILLKPQRTNKYGEKTQLPCKDFCHYLRKVIKIAKQQDLSIDYKETETHAIIELR